jgi:hypothetical protein
MCRVKRSLYPDDMRFVGDCDVKQIGNRFEIIASVAPPYMDGPTGV